ncbi:uncharacterized protein LOC123664401 [Melitaea cinxia]|uniref:uncharacterized protein LOC123664401 n=1 Tax=Melitaea cinxia TaxID=113334 RepID=UPI001E272D23|nr:uncharacterized protein LOC123664401 [Melitaea cinxia]
MENEEKHCLKFLEDRPYRYLQQMAKSLGLPSNFKKVYLIELIHAKKFKSERDVNTIIHRVKLERLRLSKVRRETKKRKMQLLEVSMNKSCSPPITFTPKRPNTCIRYSPELTKNLITYNPKKSLIQNDQNPTPNASRSDRILRSFNMKTLKPNYALLNGQDIVKSHLNPMEARVKIIRNSNGYPHINVTAKCIVKKHRPTLLSNSKSALKTHLMLTQSADLPHNSTPKRQRTISGIYPLSPSETIPRNITTESLCLRKIDGTLTRINALVQKRVEIMPKQKNNYKNAEINIQDIINGFDMNSNEHDSTNNYLQSQYPNLSSIDSYNDLSYPIERNTKDNLNVYSVYYHKKIRSEEIRCQRLRDTQEDERLPKINDVFSKFNDLYKRDLTKPLYVQVSSESERSQNHPIYTNRSANTMLLEPLYNFKSPLLTNTPLLQIATTSNTKCVYSVPIIATAILLNTLLSLGAVKNQTSEPMQQKDTAVYSANSGHSQGNQNLHAFEVDNHRNDQNMDPRLYEFLNYSEQNSMRKNYSQYGDFSSSSLETQDMSATLSIPEMVEDALEIISQDGDYMEQITMDANMQCLLCSWAGPKTTLEYHIKKDHWQQILKQHGSEWAIPWTLPSSGTESGYEGPQLLEHDSCLYVLSVKYEDPDFLTASVTSLSTEPAQKFGSITIYNKLSGEPFSWSGHIQPLSPDYFTSEISGLRVELSRLDLLPNSANLRLVNRELVTDSPGKVIIGQPMLNDIHLILFVKIYY